MLRLPTVLAAVFLSITPLSLSAADRVDIVWPTPHTAFQEGRSIEAFIQPTASGEIESGTYGCVRSQGYQFHEGIDIKPVARDRKGEPTDPIFAAMTGVVKFINPKGGVSSYGRYIIIEHTDLAPSVITLYAHLASIAPGLQVGQRVEKGQVIGIMGHSAGGYSIPKDRSHLHFEIGFWMTRDFQSWYGWKKFGSPNEHGLWNGMNLMGIDPLDFFRKHRSGQVNGFQEYLAQIPTALKFRIATNRVPDFIQRYPALLIAPMPTAGLVAGWEVECSWTGLPIRWRPLTGMEVMGMKQNQVEVLFVDRPQIIHNRGKGIAKQKGSGWVPGKDLDTMLQQVFGVRR